jgi:hypothetical protein
MTTITTFRMGGNPALIRAGYPKQRVTVPTLVPVCLITFQQRVRFTYK